MRIRLIACAAGALAALPGCGVGTDPGGGPPDNRGTLIAAFDEMLNLTWSSDGSELFFIEGNRIRAASAAGGSMRTLYASNIDFGHMVAAANKLYVSVPRVGSPAAFQILRIDPSDNAVDTILVYAGQVPSYVFAVSTDERLVAFGDSLYDLVAGTRRPLPRGIPWSFSADGSQLIYDITTIAQIATNTRAYVLIATSDVSSQTLLGSNDLVTRAYNTVRGHYWDGNAPKFLRVFNAYPSKGVDAVIIDALTGTEREIASIETDNTGEGEAAISADGKRVVIWLGGLHIIDTESRSDSVVATISGAQVVIIVFGSVMLSPDGTRASYIMHEGATLSTTGIGKLYVVAAH